MLQKLIQHPAAVGENYLQHFAKAAGFGLQMIAAGLACLVHAALPFLFQQTGSDVIRELHQALEQRLMHAGDPEKTAALESLPS
ncbi:MAG: DUF6356 family protein [bacterium]